MKIKRCRFIYIWLESDGWEHLVPNPPFEPRSHTRIMAFSIASGKTTLLINEQFTALTYCTDNEWTEITPGSDVTPEHAAALCEAGLAFLNDGSSLSVSIEQRDRLVSDVGWKGVSAACHGINMWEDIHTEVGDYGKLDDDGNIATNPKDPREVLGNLSTAPSEFLRLGGYLARVPLPIVEESEEVDRLLRARRTRRAYLDQAVSLGSVSKLLYSVFGYSEYANLMPTLTVLRKSSPSGGSLHPTECYLIALNIDGLDTGIYHYSTETHSLDMLRKESRLNLQELAQQLAAGQFFIRQSAYVVILTTRFDRLYWKYKDHSKAYSVSMYDIGHLSQTFYLISTAMGLGAAFLGAISDVNANHVLGLDGIQEAARAMLCGGHPEETLVRNLEKTFEPRRL